MDMVGSLLIFMMGKRVNQGIAVLPVYGLLLKWEEIIQPPVNTQKIMKDK